MDGWWPGFFPEWAFFCVVYTVYTWDRCDTYYYLVILGWREGGWVMRTGPVNNKKHYSSNSKSPHESFWLYTVINGTFGKVTEQLSACPERNRWTF